MQHSRGFWSERLEVQARNADAFRGRCVYGCHACGGSCFLQVQGDAGRVSEVLVVFSMG